MVAGESGAALHRLAAQLPRGRADAGQSGEIDEKRSRPMAASIRSNSRPASPLISVPCVQSSPLGMSARIISPEAGSPAGQTRGADGRGEGEPVARGEPGLEQVELSGQGLRGRLGGFGGGGAGAAGSSVRGFSQSRGASPTSVSTPASVHHAKALSAAAGESRSLPLSTPGMESSRRPGWSTSNSPSICQTLAACDDTSPWARREGAPGCPNASRCPMTW
jgi:hypothetical protein